MQYINILVVVRLRCHHNSGLLYCINVSTFLNIIKIYYGIEMFFILDLQPTYLSRSSKLVHVALKQCTGGEQLSIL